MLHFLQWILKGRAILGPIFAVAAICLSLHLQFIQQGKASVAGYDLGEFDRLLSNFYIEKFRNQFLTCNVEDEAWQ